jgi:hypothetical protein
LERAPAPAGRRRPVASTWTRPAFQQGSAVEGARSECLRRPPQIRPQPTHLVRQSIAWHPEVNGDVAVAPTVYETAVQQRAVVCPQIPEESPESVTTDGMHWGDLGPGD